MCQDCGCGDPEVVPIEVQEKILAENDHRAAHNREHFRAAGVLALNLMGSPGCGKTALLEATARAWREADSPVRRLAALSGDLATDNDARRLKAAGIPSGAITTGQGCHLDAALVHHALHHLEAWKEAAVLFVENVGNLVCPAIYDLGQEANVVALSVTEGVDKPLKYPVIFHHADLVLITKTDLLPHLPGVEMEEIVENLHRVTPEPRILPVSAVSGDGLEAWIDWLETGLEGLDAGSAGAGHDHSRHHPPSHTTPSHTTQATVEHRPDAQEARP